jgi:hypothetical protein
MITSKGQQIVTKFLLGQAPSYASHIAIGCGAVPVDENTDVALDPTTQALEFEMLRVPVTSRGVVNDLFTKQLVSIDRDLGGDSILETVDNHGMKIGQEFTLNFPTETYGEANFQQPFGGSFVVKNVTANTITFTDLNRADEDSWPEPSASGEEALGYLIFSKERIIFKAELPSDQRYQITELALYPANNNVTAAQYDSKVISSFSSAEGWQWNNGTSIEVIPSKVAIEDDENNILNNLTGTVCFLAASNPAFDQTPRKQRYEPPRFKNQFILLAGDSCNLDSDFDIVGTNSYLETSNISLDFSKNSPDDFIKLAFSLISADLNPGGGGADTVRIKLQFINNFTSGFAVPPAATANIELVSADFSGGNNRYKVVDLQLKDFIRDSGFAWSNINLIRLYGSIFAGGSPTDGIYLGFDGIRLDNVNTQNPLYGMTAFTKIKNVRENLQPILKLENTSNYIEYRFSLGVL